MAFMVVGLHARFLGEFSLLGQYLTVNGLFRIAVPIFLIINGFYFYPVLTKNKQFNWFKRIITIYIVWMVFYSYFWFAIPDFSFIGITTLARDVMLGYFHLWYISGMIGGAIMLLILRRLPSIILVITITLTFLCGVIIQYLGNYHVFEESVLDELFNYHWFHRNMLLFSYPFFCIGYLINKHSLYMHFTFKSASILSGLGLLLLLAESYFNYYQQGRDGGFDNFFSLLLVCPFIFILFMKFNIPGKSKNIALYSSAIYFIHWFYLIVFRRFTEFEPTLLTVCVILISAVTSYFIIKVNNRLKFIL